jgi:hypothetical protein
MFHQTLIPLLRPAMPGRPAIGFCNARHIFRPQFPHFNAHCPTLDKGIHRSELAQIALAILPSVSPISPNSKRRHRELIPAKTTPAFDPAQALSTNAGAPATPIADDQMPSVCCPRALIFSQWESNMKLVGLCSIAVVLGSITSMAQASGHKVSQPAVASVIPGSMNCPVDITAKRGLGRGQMQRSLDNAQQYPGPSQALQLTLNNTSYSEIVGVRVTAYGLNASGQLTPAETASSDSSAMQKSFDLKLKVNPKSTASVELELTGFTAVSYLNVDSIRYAGGSKWQPTAQRTCQVVPDGMMLISSR